jgi:hypothetical protein
MYTVWTLVQLSDGEAPVPLTKEYESESLPKCVEFLESRPDIALQVCAGNICLFNNTQYIFERDGSKIYKRLMGSTKRELVYE